jgi:hypothetical protein
MKISTDGTEDSFIEITKGIIKKYNYMESFDLNTDLPDEDFDGTPTFSSGTCDNFALEYHFRLKFDPIDSAGAGSFKLTKAYIDIVYGKLTPDATDSTVVVARKTSVEFFQDDKSVLNSGSPGYIGGKRLRIGEMSTSLPGKEYDDEYIME